MPTAYSYVRFSSPEQAKGHSLERQTEAAQKLCAERGWKLDTSLKPALGKSAWSGEHLAEGGGLKAFLDTIKAGRVKRGSYLIVENLDRLSRQNIRKALTLFFEIIDAGVKIVTLSPELRIHDDLTTEDMAGLLVPLVSFNTAYEESKKKSDRVGKAWAKKRSRIKEGHKLTGACPQWLTINKEHTRYSLKPGAAAVIKRIFKLAINHGCFTIAKTLNAEGIENFCQRKSHKTGQVVTYWTVATVGHIIRGREVLGEYQPHKYVDGVRKPDGELEKDYYPAIPGLSESDWRKANDALDAREHQRGPVGDKVANLFSNFIFDAVDGAGMTLAGVVGKKVIASSRSQRGEARTKFCGFPYASLERAVLMFIEGLSAADIVPPERDQTKLEKRLADVEAKLTHNASKREKLKEAIRKAPDSDSLIEMAISLDAEKKELSAELEHLKSEVSSNEAEQLHETKHILTLLAKAKGDELAELRSRLRAKLQSIVERIDVTIKAEKRHDRTARIEITGKQGAFPEIMYCRTQTSKSGLKEMIWQTVSNSFGDGSQVKSIDGERPDMAKYERMLEKRNSVSRTTDKNGQILNDGLYYKRLPKKQQKSA